SEPKIDAPPLTLLVKFVWFCAWAGRVLWVNVSVTDCDAPTANVVLLRSGVIVHGPFSATVPNVSGASPLLVSCNFAVLCVTLGKFGSGCWILLKIIRSLNGSPSRLVTVRVADIRHRFSKPSMTGTTALRTIDLRETGTFFKNMRILQDQETRTRNTNPASRDEPTTPPTANESSTGN